MTGGPVTYEVNLVPDPEIEDEFDDWLDAHVVDMLRLPGFLTAVVRRAELGPGEIQRTVQYELRDRAALDADAAHPAAGTGDPGDRHQQNKPDQTLSGHVRVPFNESLLAHSYCPSRSACAAQTDCSTRIKKAHISLRLRIV